MKLAQYIYTKDGWNQALDNSLDSLTTLIIVFASPDIAVVKEPLDKLISFFPKSKFIGCSTAGEIFDRELPIDRFVVQVIKFEKTSLKVVYKKIESSQSSKEVGESLASSLVAKNIKSAFVLSDGLMINGSKLTEGFASKLPSSTIITGGLAGDDANFNRTWVLVNREPKIGFVTAVGFYGDALYVGYGSRGGWDTLGVKREVTKSIDNILYELDGQPALKLYKRYLGDRASDLPRTGLLFPLAIYDGDEKKVRTILAIDEEYQSITFAGDIPQGSKATLMKANLNRLIDGASDAAESIRFNKKDIDVLCCIAISCVGRKLVLRQRVDEEIEAVKDMLPQYTQQIGYYSYGEISPLISGKCDLHNQTMTLTLLGEF